MVMVMNGFDVDFDGDNEFYAVNGIPFHYDSNPIQIKVGELVRIFLVNILEYDPINSFHLHANFFHYYPTGTSLTPANSPTRSRRCRRSAASWSSATSIPGTYMFHAHKTEFAELGWTGIFRWRRRDGST